VETSRVRKSRSVETTFDTDIADHAQLEGTLRQQSKKLAEGLQRAQERGRTIAIKVRLDDWTTITRARSIDSYINDEATIIAVALELFRDYAPDRPVRLLGVRVGTFEGVDDEPAEPVARAAPPGQLVLPLGV
jgi:DNA polymerase-4